jgi:hypothetical protein
MLFCWKDLTMHEMIAYCGLDCLQCGALIATQTKNDEKRAEVAALWSEEYGGDIQPEDIHCDGCISEGGHLFGHCAVCEIRKCGLAKGVENCAHCGEYPCMKITDFFVMVPDAKIKLDGIRAGL